MPQVNIVVNDHAYTVACDEGQEDHLRRLGELIDHRVRKLIASVGQMGDARLILMAALVLADELGEAVAKVEILNVNADRAAETLENTAERIEAIAARLSPP